MAILCGYTGDRVLHWLPVPGAARLPRPAQSGAAARPRHQQQPVQGVRQAEQGDTGAGSRDGFTEPGKGLY